MTVKSDLDALVGRLRTHRVALLERRAELLAVDSRFDDVIWPCEQHEQIGMASFDSPNTCLVAEALASQLWVSRPVMEDIVAYLPDRLRPLAATWFFTHQLVHVSQGLGYHDFRTLNRVGNRHETMRPDCDADFISLKTLAVLMARGETRATGDTAGVSSYESCFALLVDDLVPAMMGMEPNIFIPRRREIEHKRMFALLLLRYYVARASDGDPLPDGSFFPWWTEDRTTLYLFVGQVHTLGRGPITVDPDRLSTLLTQLEAGQIEAAYETLAGIDWPRLNTATLPNRLLQAPS